MESNPINVILYLCEDKTDRTTSTTSRQTDTTTGHAITTSRQANGQTNTESG